MDIKCISEIRIETIAFTVKFAIILTSLYNWHLSVSKLEIILYTINKVCFYEFLILYWIILQLLINKFSIKLLNSQGQFIYHLEQYITI